MPIVSSPLAPVSIVDQVTTSVRGSILAGQLKPGSAFSITELAAGLGVSPIPVREALQRLEAQGLIVRRRARTAIVAPLSSDELRDVYDMRILVECETVEMAAPLLTDGIIVGLEANLRALQGCSLNDEAFWENHAAFHMKLLAPALTPLRERIVLQLWHAAERYVRLLYAEVGFDNQPDQYEYHHPLLEAAQARSASKLGQLLSEHYRDNVTRMLGELASIID